jgi:DNA polymerase
MRILHLDFECYSHLDLKAVGVENYVRSPGFVVTVIGWAFDDGPTQSFSWPHTTLPADVRRHIAEGGTIKAWNAAFEWNILRLHYNKIVAPEQMDCVMQRSLAYGLPGSLEAAGEALHLKIVKDATARRLMLQMGKPKKDGTAWHHDPLAQSKLHDLAAYCMRDVEAERALDKVLPPLPKFERALSLVDAQINERGILIDTTAAGHLGVAAWTAVSAYNAECDMLTCGAVQRPGTEVAKLMDWLAHNGAPMKNLAKETVAKALEHPLMPGTARRVLELRQLVAKSSLAKIERMVAWASSHDGRARNTLQFYGAGRTGRWAGRGIQVQNLPRKPKALEPQKIIDSCKVEPRALGLVYAKPLTVISQSLRSCLVARPGHTLISIDLSQIEARVLAWIADDRASLKAYRDFDAGTGEDIYVLEAAKHGSTNRQLGKVLTLACGYGMGPDKFRTTALEQYGVELTISEAENAVRIWRAQHEAIKFLWWDLENLILEMLGKPNPRVSIKFWNIDENGVGTVRGRQGQTLNLMVKLVKGVLGIRKPNGVKLWYHEPRTELSQDKGRESLTFMGVDGVTKRWGVQRTYGGRLVENIVQSVARDVMGEALLAAPDRVVMTVHDDIVWETHEAGAAGAADILRGVVEHPPAWTKGLPIASEIKISRRFGGM